MEYKFGETSLERHKKRVGLHRQIGVDKEVDTETGWDCLDSSRKRMKASIPGSDMSLSFETALDSYPNTELFSRWEDGDVDKYKCIVRNMKDDWKRDDKFINAPFALGTRVGDTLTWDRLGIRWLVVWQDYIHRDYFRGEINKATHLIRWKNKHGSVKEQWAVVKGPVETRAKYEQTSGVVQNARQNDHIEILIGANDKENIAYLSRFKKIRVLSRTWRVHVIDDISSENIYRMSCVEDFNNEDTDDILELIPDGKVDFAPNEETEKGTSIRLVGEKYLRKGFEYEFYAVNEKDEIVEDIEYTVLPKELVTITSNSKGRLKIKGLTQGKTLQVTGETPTGEKNSIEVVIVSILG